MGLSPEGDIRLIDIEVGGRVVMRGDTLPREFEVFVIKANHPKYRLALSRVLTLLPGLRPGAGMTRLAPPVQAPWPFFDYDFVMAPDFNTINEVNRNFGTRDNPTVFVSINAHVSTTPPYGEWPVEGVPHPQIWHFSWGANGDVLLCCGAQRGARVVLRLPVSHAQHRDVLAELRRVQPGLRRGAGFTHTPVFAPPPWPFVPFEEPMDQRIAEAIENGPWYHRPFDPPPPPMPAPTAQE